MYKLWESNITIIDENSAFRGDIGHDSRSKCSFHMNKQLKLFWIICFVLFLKATLVLWNFFKYVSLIDL